MNAIRVIAAFTLIAAFCHPTSANLEETDDYPSGKVEPELIEKERMLYQSLDGSIKAQVRNFATSIKFGDLEELLNLLEKESHQGKCQYLEQVDEVFSKHVGQPCENYVRKMESVYEDYLKRSERHESEAASEDEDFFQHLFEYQRCSFAIKYQGDIAKDIKGLLLVVCREQAAQSENSNQQ